MFSYKKYFKIVNKLENNIKVILYICKIKYKVYIID